MQSLKDKRLLLLGGNMWKESIKKFADEQGITLIAVSNDPDAPIFSIAEESYVISSTDAAAMKKFIRDKKIDGVYMGSNETVISAACQYLDELDMPCYCNKKQWDFIQNKAGFKSCCDSFGLPVLKRIDIPFDEIDSAQIDYPVITKPTDGCGSSGFSVCGNSEELKAGYKKACDNSSSGSVIIEKFVKNDSVVVFYTFSNGKAYFSGIEDKYPFKFEEQGSYVCGVNIFESSFTGKFRERYEAKLEKMFKSLGIKEGTIWIEVFQNGDECYFNEAGYRYGGSITIYPVDYLFNINQPAADIYYALTGESELYGFSRLSDENVPKKSRYCIYAVYLNSGTIAKISGVEAVKAIKEVTAFPIAKSNGDIISSSGSIAQAFGFVHFVFDTEDEWRETVNKILTALRITDENGNEMINAKLNADNFVFRK